MNAWKHAESSHNPLAPVATTVAVFPETVILKTTATRMCNVPGPEEKPHKATPLFHWVCRDKGALGQVALVTAGGHFTQLACRGMRR